MKIKRGATESGGNQQNEMKMLKWRNVAAGGTLNKKCIITPHAELLYIYIYIRYLFAGVIIQSGAVTYVLFLSLLVSWLLSR